MPGVGCCSDITPTLQKLENGKPTYALRLAYARVREFFSSLWGHFLYYGFSAIDKMTHMMMTGSSILQSSGLSDGSFIVLESY